MDKKREVVIRMKGRNVHVKTSTNHAEYPDMAFRIMFCCNFLLKNNIFRILNLII